MYGPKPSLYKCQGKVCILAVASPPGCRHACTPQPWRTQPICGRLGGKNQTIHLVWYNQVNFCLNPVLNCTALYCNTKSHKYLPYYKKIDKLHIELFVIKND